MINFWQKLPKPFTVLAPMEGVTDFAFRETISRYLPRPDVLFTEFTNVDGLNSNGFEKTIKRFKFSKTQKPIIAQVWGTNPKNFFKSAKIIKDLGFDGIDINMGCPDREAVKTGGGAALIKNTKLVKEIINTTRNGAKNLPFSIKTRLGYDRIVTDEWIGFLLEQKIDAISIHLRTAGQKSLGLANWNELKKVVNLRNRISPNTIIIGNGDVKSYLNVKLYNESKIIGNAEGKPVNLCGCSKVTGNIIYSTVTINSNIIDLSAIESEVANNNDNFKIPLTIAGNQALVNGVLTINSNDTLTISTGTYYFNGIKLSANSKLYFKGRIRIYSKGKISIPDESEVHSNGSPNNLIIYCNTSQAVHLNGSGELQGIVYAPTSDIAVCGTNITVCNVFGKSVYMNGANKIVGVKYDGQPSQLLASSKRLAPSDVFVKGEVYAYPNPAKNGYQPTIHMECGIADYVEIYIYNIAGELVQSDKIYTQPIIKNNKYAYEYMWDVSNKASGIYLYLVRAHKDGEKTIKVLKKVAIIK